MKKFLRAAAISFAGILLFTGIAVALLPLPGHIPVLMYHVIDTPERAALEKNVVSRQSFERQMAFLAALRYHVLSMQEYEEIISGRRKPRGREILITFDDGDNTFARNALPVLQKYRLPVTLFLISAHLENGTYGSMRTEQVRELLKNPWITVESHSRTHPFLSQVSDAQLEEELAGAKKELEDFFHVPIRAIAYPSGDMNRRVADAARQYGYALAFTTRGKKLNGVPEGPWSLTRVKISRTSDILPAFWIKVSGIYENVRRFFRSLKISPPLTPKEVLEE